MVRKKSEHYEIPVTIELYPDYEKEETFTVSFTCNTVYEFNYGEDIDGRRGSDIVFLDSPEIIEIYPIPKNSHDKQYICEYICDNYSYLIT